MKKFDEDEWIDYRRQLEATSPFDEFDDDEWRDYRWMLENLDAEVYHDLLEKTVNNHTIGDEFDIPHNGDLEETYWKLAEWEGYIDIPWVTTRTRRVKVLKQY